MSEIGIDHWRRHAARRALVAGAAVLGLTSLHHVYGAIVYDTPWRYHAVVVSAIGMAVILAAFRIGRSRAGSAAGAVAEWVFLLASLALPVLSFGAFEGFYNHVLKNALYFGGASADTMRSLFPPPTYELPNDLVFELTGVLQVVPAAIACVYLIALIGGKLRRRPRIA